MKKLPKIKIGKKPTYIKIAEDVNFFEIFQKIEEEFSTCFIFESLGEEGKFSRFSILGFDPDHIISARENVLMFDGKKIAVDNPYYSLREIMPAKTITRNYAGGLIGYLSYEALNYFESSYHVKVHPDFEQFMFGVYTDGIIFDKVTNELFYFYYTQNRLDTIQKIIQKKLNKKNFRAQHISNGLNQKEHAEIVKDVKEQIKLGNTFQCEVGFKSKYKIAGDPIAIYEKLRNINPSPFMYYLKFDSKKIIGASPELLFSLRDNEMTTRPLAGTTKRGINEKEDQKLSRLLLGNAKEKAEHMMLVDLHRNDLGKVSKFGTVRIKELMTIKKFSHVQHISSEVIGLIANDHDMFSALASNFPMGTITGAPKIETIKIIDKNEREARGPYGGGVGHFGFNGECTFALTLRSLFINNTNAYTQTCGGIVYDSETEKEYEEIQRKMSAMKKVLEV